MWDTFVTFLNSNAFIVKNKLCTMERRHLTQADGNRAIGMLENGARQVDVALLFNVTQSVISRLYQRYRESGTVEERPRTGRPRATNNREDRLLVREARRNPRAHCNLLRQELLHATGTRITARTVLNSIMESELRCRRPIRRVPLTPAHIGARLAWCEEIVNWQDEWAAVRYADESRFGVHSDSRSAPVSRRDSYSLGRNFSGRSY
jgi:transposase